MTVEGVDAISALRARSGYPDNGGDGVLVDYDEEDAAPTVGLLEEVRRLAALQVVRSLKAGKAA